MDDLKSIIGKVATGATLSRDEAASAFDSMMSGEATPSQMGGLLMALRVRGETVDEITGAVSAMRAKMLRVKDRKSTRLNSSHANISYAVFCLKKKKKKRSKIIGVKRKCVKDREVWR